MKIKLSNVINESDDKMERNNLSTGNIYCIDTNKVAIVSSQVPLWNRQEVYETEKKRKRFPFKAAIPSLLVATNFSEQKLKIYQVKIKIWH